MPVKLAQGGVPDSGQRAPAFDGDLVDGSLGPVADPLGSYLAHETLVGESLERAVNRADLNVRPGLGVVGLGLLPDLMPVQRPAGRQRPEDEQSNGRHMISHTRVISYEQVRDALLMLSVPLACGFRTAGAPPPPNRDRPGSPPRSGRWKALMVTIPYPPKACSRPAS